MINLTNNKNRYISLKMLQRRVQMSVPNKKKDTTYRGIFGVTDENNSRIGRGHNKQIFTPMGGLPKAIIKGNKILTPEGETVIGILKNGKIIKPDTSKPVGYYNDGTISEPPPDGGKILGKYQGSVNDEGVKAAAFLLILGKE